jgi:hypothetical protein
MFQLGNLALSIQGMTESGTVPTLKSIKGCLDKGGYSAGPRRQKVGAKSRKSSGEYF